MIGGAGKKISTMVELAEELYERVNDLRARMESMSGTVDETAARVETLEAELAEQRALVEAIAEEQGVDVDAVMESVAAGAGEPGGEAEGEVQSGTAAGGTGERGE